MLIPCGKCPVCLSKSRQKWLVRLSSEFKYCLSAYFVTLTYDNEHIPYKDGLQSLRKSDLQNFWKRFRKRLPDEYDIKYYACGEYGTDTFRPHYHFILYLYGEGEPIHPYYMDVNYIRPSWTLGISDTREANNATANYCLKDILKLQMEKIEELPFEKPFHLSSNGLGEREAYEKAQKGYPHTYFVQDGKKVGIPRYMRLKMYECMDADEVERFQNEIHSALKTIALEESSKELKQTKNERIRERENNRAKEESIIFRAKKNCKI